MLARVVLAFTAEEDLIELSKVICSGIRDLQVPSAPAVPSPDVQAISTILGTLDLVAAGDHSQSLLEPHQLPNRAVL